MDADGLVRAIRAALDETERIARAATPGPWRIVPQDYGLPGALSIEGEGGSIADNESGAIPPGPEDAAHIAHNDPAAVLRRVSADREILALYETELRVDAETDEWTPGVNKLWGGGRRSALRDAVRSLARGLGINPEEETEK